MNKGIQAVRSKCAHWAKSARVLTVRYPVMALFVAFVGGIVFWGAFNTSLELTNTEAFCISCHEMEENVYREYKKTIHYANRTGIRATCPDCHVPKDWWHKVVRKVGATNELFHKVLGTISTPTKFEQRRLQLASIVWDSMRQTDSRECRNCHAYTYMKGSSQGILSMRKHQQAARAGKTCITCHMGIAHQLPKDFDETGAFHENLSRKKVPCDDCHKEMAHAPEDL